MKKIPRSEAKLVPQSRNMYTTGGYRAYYTNEAGDVQAEIDEVQVGGDFGVLHHTNTKYGVSVWVNGKGYDSDRSKLIDLKEEAVKYTEGLS